MAHVLRHMDTVERLIYAAVADMASWLRVIDRQVGTGFVPPTYLGGIFLGYRHD